MFWGTCVSRMQVDGMKAGWDSKEVCVHAEAIFGESLADRVRAIGCGIGALTALLHQAILTKALRRLHQASGNPSPLIPTDQGFSQPLTPDPSAQTAESIESQVPPQTPPVTASTSGEAGIRNTYNSRPPPVLRTLGIAGQEVVHVEEEILFPGLEWPEDHETPVLKAAWLFSHLT